MVDDATGVPEGTCVVSLSCGARIGGGALRRRRPPHAGDGESVWWAPSIRLDEAARPVVLAVFLRGLSRNDPCAEPDSRGLTMAGEVRTDAANTGAKRKPPQTIHCGGSVCGKAVPRVWLRPCAGGVPIAKLRKSRCDRRSKPRWARTSVSGYDSVVPPRLRVATVSR